MDKFEKRKKRNQLVIMIVAMAVVISMFGGYIVSYTTTTDPNTPTPQPTVTQSNT